MGFLIPIRVVSDYFFRNQNWTIRIMLQILCENKSRTIEKLQLLIYLAKKFKTT